MRRPPGLQLFHRRVFVELGGEGPVADGAVDLGEFVAGGVLVGQEEQGGEGEGAVGPEEVEVVDLAVEGLAGGAGGEAVEEGKHFGGLVGIEEAVDVFHGGGVDAVHPLAVVAGHGVGAVEGGVDALEEGGELARDLRRLKVNEHVAGNVAILHVPEGGVVVEGLAELFAAEVDGLLQVDLGAVDGEAGVDGTLPQAIDNGVPRLPVPGGFHGGDVDGAVIVFKERREDVGGERIVELGKVVDRFDAGVGGVGADLGDDREEVGLEAEGEQSAALGIRERHRVEDPVGEACIELEERGHAGLGFRIVGAEERLDLLAERDLEIAEGAFAVGKFFGGEIVESGLDGGVERGGGEGGGGCGSCGSDEAGGEKKRSERAHHRVPRGDRRIIAEAAACPCMAALATMGSSPSWTAWRPGEVLLGRCTMTNELCVSPPARPRARGLTVGLWLIGAGLLANAGAMVYSQGTGHAPDISLDRTAFAQAIPSGGQTGLLGARGIYMMPAQLGPTTFGVYLMDVDSGTICVYKAIPETSRFRLMAARSFKNDRFLEDYDNEGLLPRDVQKVVANQRQRQSLESQTNQPTVDQTPKPDENQPDGPVGGK
jgi:hypothetical protein